MHCRCDGNRQHKYCELAHVRLAAWFSHKFETSTVQKIRLERQADGVELKQADIVLLMGSIHISTIDTTMPDDASPYVLHPNAFLLRSFWDPLQRFLAIAYFLEVPFGIAFHPEHSVGMHANLSCA
jgi:hypothetical protein